MPLAHSKLALYLLTAFAAAVLLLFILLTNASAQHTVAETATHTPIPGPDRQPVTPPKRTPPLGNLDSTLSQMAASVQSGYSTTHDAASQAPLHAADSVAVTFYLSGDTAPLLAFLRANGGDPRNIGADYVEAYVPVDLLVEASQQPNVARVQAIVPPQPAGGSVPEQDGAAHDAISRHTTDAGDVIVTSQGVAAHGADAWHAAGYTGSGVKVGVIALGFDGIRALMGTELPSTVVARCYDSLFGIPTSNLADCENGNDHGTPVTETLLDIAPDATLYIANVSSKGSLRSAVDWMILQGVDVIDVPLFWQWDGPGDGTYYYSDSPLRSVDAAVAGGALWLSAAGNRAGSTWFGTFSDNDSDRYMNFTSDSERNEVFLTAGESFVLDLRWDARWGYADIDLDMYLYHNDSEVASSIAPQLGRSTEVPLESIGYTPATSGTYSIAVEKYAGSDPSWVQLLARTGKELRFHTNGYSILNPVESANPGMLAVGSAHWDNTSIIQPYSSRGPTPDGRIKPDIVGADCTLTRTIPSFLSNCRTGIASAHIAGLAALVKQRYPEYTPLQIANYLKSTAEARGAVPNNDWGYGFAKLPNPADGTAPPDPTPAGTPITPVPTPTSTTVPTPVSGDIAGRVKALEGLIRELQAMMRGFNTRLSALEGAATAPTPTSFSSISAGRSHTCALRKDGTAVCWGDNVSSQTSLPSDETFTSIDAGDWHTCGLREDGAAVCWGNNDTGWLSPPSGETFTSLSSGGAHTCGLREDGAAVCWGNNDTGQSSPPTGTFTSVSVGRFHTCGLRADGTAVCWGDNDSDQSSPPPDETFMSISAGGEHACGLREDSTTVCWGLNEDGQSSPPSSVFSSISAGAYHTCGLRENGVVVCWGNIYAGQSSPPSGIFASISAGSYHTCGLRENDTAVCWGDNWAGQATPP